MQVKGAYVFAAAVSPSIGPAIITVFGVDVPPLALGISMLGLLFARAIAPPPLRKLTRKQEVSLTLLLLTVLFWIVTGEMWGGEPMGGGMAMVWGIGLGFSGLLVVEFFGQRVMSMLRAAFGVKTDEA